MKTYPCVTFEIVGYCNAKCPYCFTHNHPGLRRAAVKPDVFEKVLKKIIDYGIYGDHSVVYLYNWGEPFLHPQFAELISILNKYGVRYGLSTNASVLPDLKNADFHNLYSIMVSMPGFSQKSYDKIHGFDFEKIKTNIVALNDILKKQGYQHRLTLTYHIYQFNLDEIYPCHLFANSIGATFNPYYASINDWWQRERYVKNQMSIDELKKISNDIFLSKFDEGIKSAPKDGCSMFDRYFVIDEFANVTQCCLVPTNHEEYNCGNILEDDIETIIKKKLGSKVCRECIESGFAAGQDLVLYPGFYFSLCNQISASRSAAESFGRQNEALKIQLDLKDIDLYDNSQKQCYDVVIKIKNRVISLPSILEWIGNHTVNKIKVLNALATEAANNDFNEISADFFNELLKLEPTDPAILFNAGKIYFKGGSYKDAYDTLENIKEKSGDVDELIREVKQKL